MKQDGLILGAALSSDEQRVLSWSSDGTMREWNAVTGEPVGPPLIFGGNIAGASLSDDKRRMITWSWTADFESSNLHVWDVEKRIIGSAIQHSELISGARLTNDGRRILTWSNNITGIGPCSARLFEVSTGQQLGPDMKHDGPVSGALFIKGEMRSSLGRKMVRARWDAVTGHQIGPAMKHDGEVEGVVLSSDQKRSVSWSGDHSVRIWNVATGEQIGPAMLHDSGVGGVVLSSDEQRILSWANDVRLECSYG